jgi:hypothetical protein
MKWTIGQSNITYFLIFYFQKHLHFKSLHGDIVMGHEELMSMDMAYMHMTGTHEHVQMVAWVYGIRFVQDIKSYARVRQITTEWVSLV